MAHLWNTLYQNRLKLRNNESQFKYRYQTNFPAWIIDFNCDPTTDRTNIIHTETI